jgi:hypothetical protein
VIIHFHVYNKMVENNGKNPTEWLAGHSLSRDEFGD